MVASSGPTPYSQTKLSMGPTLSSAVSAEIEPLFVENGTYAFDTNGVQFLMNGLEFLMRGLGT